MKISQVQTRVIQGVSLQLLDGGGVQLLVHDGSFLSGALNRHVSVVFFRLPIYFQI